jgi:hypothetical protein
MFSKNIDEYFTGFSIGDLEEIEMLRIVKFINHWYKEVEPKDVPEWMPEFYDCYIASIWVNLDEKARGLKGLYTVSIYGRHWIGEKLNTVEKIKERQEKMEALRKYLLTNVILDS